jgi:phage replication O-like protein O
MTSSVQLENGYTRIANEILETIAKIKLSPTQHSLIYIIWRYTYGFNRKEHTLSLSFLSKATNCDQRNIQRELKRLEDRNIIIQSTAKNRRIIRFNKNYNEWINNIGEIDIGETANRRNRQSKIGEIANRNIGGIDNQEIKKEKLKEIYISIVDYLNTKTNKSYKATTKKTQSLIDGRLKEGFTLDDFKKVIDNKIATWKGTEWEKYLRPETLFGNKFEGYLNEKNSTKETEEGLKGSNWRGSDKRL